MVKFVPFQLYTNLVIAGNETFICTELFWVTELSVSVGNSKEIAIIRTIPINKLSKVGLTAQTAPCCNITKHLAVQTVIYLWLQYTTNS